MGSKTSPAVGGEGERERGRERRCQAKKLVDIQYLMYWVSFYVQYKYGQREGERGREKANLFSVHNSSRVKIDVDSIPILANFKTVHLYIQINARYCTCNS